MATQNNQNVALSWAKCHILATALNADGTLGETVLFPTPVEGTTTLSTEAGEKLEAKVEGGEVIASLTKTSNFSLEFEIHVATGYLRPLAPYTGVDGVIFGNYQVKIIPADPEALGLLFKRTSMNVQKGFDTTKGITWKYVVTALKPAAGEMLEEYEQTGLECALRQMLRAADRIRAENLPTRH